MTNVIAWPPVGLVAWEMTRHDPVSESTGMLGGLPRTSSQGISRRLIRAHVTGIGGDLAGAGYMEVFKRMLAGGRHLVRIEASSGLWRGARSANRNGVLTWTSGGVALNWTSGGVALNWRATTARGTAGTVGGWPVILATGLPPDTLVCRPDDRVVLIRADNSEVTSRCIAVVRSDADGEATIPLETALTGAGALSLGDAESLVCKVLEIPRALQPVLGGYAYEWEMVEVFEAEWYDSWVEVSPPWR